MTRLYPNAQAIDDLTYRLTTHMRRYGYQRVDLPILEVADLFLIKAGDQIINQLFTFERYGQQWALRPEFTAAAAYHYGVTQAPGTIVRWQFNGPVFEDAPDSPTANHQRYSIGAELIGASTPTADAEIIAMAAFGLDALGISEWKITLGHAGLTRQLLSSFHIDLRTQRLLLHHLESLRNPILGKAFVLEQIDRYLGGAESISETELYATYPDMPANAVTTGTRTREEITQRLLKKRQMAVQRPQISEALDLLEQWVKIAGSPAEVFKTIKSLVADNQQANSILANWQEIVSNLEAYNIPLSVITIQADLARSWEYYTGMIFELHQGDLHLGGGGRYDELAQLVGNSQNAPSVGFVYYGDALLVTAPFASHEPTFVIVPNTIDQASGAVQWAQQLRSHDMSIQIAMTLPEASQHVLVLDDLGQLHWGDKVYKQDAADILIADLKR